MTLPAKVSPGEALEAVIMKGDLAKLLPEQRTEYYQRVCDSLGINPYTKPFEFMVMQGKMILYPTRSCADQLRMKHNVSLEIVSRDVSDGILTIHVRARMPDGRTDEDLGAVPFPPNLVGEARSNAELKAITKAKRRVTLSICGLGWSDESELDSIPGAARVPAEPAANVMAPVAPANEESSTEAHPSDFKALDARLSAAAAQGTYALHEAWGALSKSERKLMEAAKDRRYKVMALQADDEAVTEDGDGEFDEAPHDQQKAR